MTTSGTAPPRNLALRSLDRSTVISINTVSFAAIVAEFSCWQNVDVRAHTYAWKFASITDLPVLKNGMPLYGGDFVDRQTS